MNVLIETMFRFGRLCQVHLKPQVHLKASVLLNFFMNWGPNVVSVLHYTHRHYHAETRFVFIIFVSMSRPRSIYVASMQSIFLFQLHFYNDCFFAYFLDYVPLLLDDKVGEG